MARNVSYGQLLREARERSRFDLPTMARRLHVRVDILRAIEESDFERLPAQGYTKNMVRAYARSCGLDQNRICNMYLDEVHLYETGRERASRERDEAQFERPHRNQSRPSSRQEAPLGRRTRFIEAPIRNTSSSSDRNQQRARQSRSGRPEGERRSAPQRERMERSRQSNTRNRPADNRQPRGGVGSRGPAKPKSKNRASDAYLRDISYNKQDHKPQRDRRSGRQPAGNYPSLYSQPMKTPAMTMPHIPALAIIAALAVIAIIVLVILFNGSKQSVDEVPDIPISGLTDTSNPEGQASTSAAPEAPTSAKFTYSIGAGDLSWIEIYQHGSDEPELAGVIEGPANKEYEVTDKLTFKAANPDGVKITVDGNEVQLTPESSSGYYVYTVNFEQMLDDWRRANLITNPASSYYARSSSASAASSSSNSSASRR